MIFPGAKEFVSQAGSGNLIPVWTTVPADLLTPVSAYLKLTSGGREKRKAASSYSFLLESVEGGETIARYTYLGADPFLILRFWLDDGNRDKRNDSGRIEILERGRRREMRGNLMSVAREVFSSFRAVRSAELPPFTAGAVGYLGYDLISLREPVPLPAESRGAKQGQRMPDAVLMFCATLLVFDHVKQQITIVRNVQVKEGQSKTALAAAYRGAERDLRRIERTMQSPPALPSASKRPAGRDASPVFRSNVSKNQFLRQVRRAKDYIQMGDIFQVVLSQRLETNITGDPFQIYRALRRVNPAPYLFFMRLGEDCVLGSSPEMLVKVTGEEVEYRPIAGTRPRGKDPEEDRRLEQELMADEKERAEHVMLVDLGRNDVGRVCRYGTVQVASLMFVERYSHVMHLVSSIRGKLRPELDAWDALWACFPAGTVTGAPKVRAMQIISELEPTRRGVYAGAVLYLDLTGNLNSCITIRSVVIRDGKAYVQVGAGIVADSVPENEYEETMNKGKGMLRAIEMAQETSRAGKRSLKHSGKHSRKRR
jgi:anthranilate synthase component 1